MKSKEILLKPEESEEKVGNFYQPSELCGAKLYSYIDVKFHMLSLTCKHAVWNENTKSIIPKHHFMK